MDRLLYYPALGLIRFLQALPLVWVARLGRGLGGLAYALDARHRRVTVRNLTQCFGGEKSAAEIRELARENFRRIGENFACAVKTAAMSTEQLKGHIELTGDKHLLTQIEVDAATSRVFAIGHFGNFELFAHAVLLLPHYQGATTYRALKTPRMNRLLLELREQSNCLFFERRTQGAELRDALRTRKLLLGLLSDQHGGDGGVRLPFFGHECSTTKAPAVLALRYGLPLHTSICYRTSLARWRIEVGELIPTHQNGQPRKAEEIMLDVNRAFEVAVRRDPANWFWVHKRWKPGKGRPASGAHAAETVPPPPAEQTV